MCLKCGCKIEEDQLFLVFSIIYVVSVEFAPASSFEYDDELAPSSCYLLQIICGFLAGAMRNGPKHYSPHG